MKTDDVKFVESPEYVEQLLRHLARSEEAQAVAKQQGLTSEDFLSSSSAGMQIYKIFGDAILSVKAPIDAALLLAMLKQRVIDERIGGLPFEDAQKLHAFIYEGVLNTEFILQDLPVFIKRQRGRKVLEENSDDIAHCMAELTKVTNGLEALRVTNKAKTVRPFAAPIKKEIFRCVKTGFKTWDGYTGGLNVGEYNLLIGYSGGGKTATATNIADDVISDQHQNVMYFSIEEPGDNIADRFYAKKFRISYQKLHQRGLNGDQKIQLELDRAFVQHPELVRSLAANLVIDDVRDLAPVTTDVLRARLELYANEGFFPDLVIADQMEFMSPLEREFDVASQWEKQGAVSSDCDKFSEYKIQGKHQFAFLLLHQAKGKPKEEFSTEEIQGFKAIINPTDGTFGLGHSEAEGGRQGSAIKRDFRLFSLKSRHSAPFFVRMKADLEFMSLSEAGVPELKALPGPQITEHPISNPIQ